METKNLFTPVVQGHMQFANRIVMAPMTRSRAIEGKANELIEIYYEQRASAGLLITEGTSPSPEGLGYARTPGIFSAEQINSWKKVVQRVHDAGGKIFMQLMHVGRVAHAANMTPGSRILAPSAVKAAGDMWTDELGLQPKGEPQEMSTADIKVTVRDFTQAAKNAIEAGFDGIELHGANGYLIEQFLNPYTNTRMDEYGGSVENRGRFLLEVTESVVNAIGKEKVGVRLSPYNSFNDMPAYTDTFNTYSHIVDELSRLDVLYVHLIDYAARSSDEGNNLIKYIRDTFPNLLILNGGYTKDRAEAALNVEGADMISFGTPFIANPDLVLRFKQGAALASPDSNTFYTPGEKGYIDYALLTADLVV